MGGQDIRRRDLARFVDRVQMPRETTDDRESLPPPAALLDNARGVGHRRIAARLGRPPGTVRGWLHTFAHHAEQVSASARRWTYAIDARALDQTGPAGSPVADAVDALGSMARACRLQLRMSASPWELAVTLTGLLYGRPRDPPGF